MMKIKKKEVENCPILKKVSEFAVISTFGTFARHSRFEFRLFCRIIRFDDFADSNK